MATGEREIRRRMDKMAYAEARMGINTQQERKTHTHTHAQGTKHTQPDLESPCGDGRDCTAGRRDGNADVPIRCWATRGPRELRAHHGLERGDMHTVNVYRE